MVSKDSNTSAGFETQAPTLAPSGTGASRPATPLRVGSYRILSVLGEGSMGVVYRAEQETPRRIVALKLIKAGRASAAALARFEYEVQILGRLQHPGIAQIFEGGTADTGFGPQPFFALELIDGVSLTKYADSNQLSMRERLSLLAKVCKGVQHAHQMGVIHRDLKPGNILVDKRSQPKILDFGIARATGSDMSPSSSEDGSRRQVGTIPYMSLEQLRGDPTGIDTRSDVYALGVIGYQLMSGQLPHATKSATIPDALRIVAASKPKPLGHFDKTLRGDVEAVIAKAMHADKARRYQSAADLAADIYRHLSDEPVSARTATPLYRFAKFSRRNRGIAIGLVGGLSLLVAGLATFIVLWRTAEKARAQAVRDERSHAASERAWDGISHVWDTALRDGGKDMTIREAIDRVAARIDAGAFDHNVDEKAQLRSELGDLYGRAGLHGDAVHQFRSAVAIHVTARGDHDLQTLQAKNELALVLMEEGKLLEKRDSFLEAKKLYRDILSTRRDIAGDDLPETLEAQSNLALALVQLKEFEEAEAVYRRSVRAHTRVWGSDHRLTLLSMNNLAGAVEKLGKLDEAEGLYRRTIALQRKHLPNDDRDTLSSIYNLAGVLKSNEKRTEAERRYREAVAGTRHTLGDAHPETIVCMLQLAQLLRDRNAYGEAGSLYREILERSREAYGDDDPNITSALIRLGMFLTEHGDPGEAEPLLREAVQLRRKAFAEGAWQLANVESALGACLTRLSRFEEAESLLLKSQPIYEKELGVDDDYTVRGMRRIVALYDAWGKPNKAADYRRQFPETP